MTITEQVAKNIIKKLLNNVFGYANFNLVGEYNSLLVFKSYN